MVIFKPDLFCPVVVVGPFQALGEGAHHPSYPGESLEDRGQVYFFFFLAIICKGSSIWVSRMYK